MPELCSAELISRTVLAGCGTHSPVLGASQGCSHILDLARIVGGSGVARLLRMFGTGEFDLGPCTDGGSLDSMTSDLSHLPCTWGEGPVVITQMGT